MLVAKSHLQYMLLKLTFRQACEGDATTSNSLIVQQFLVEKGGPTSVFTLIWPIVGPGARPLTPHHLPQGT